MTPGSIISGTAAAFGAVATIAGMNEAPNVLFVFGDQWRASATGFGGNAEVQTPHLDRLAGQSLHVPDCVAGTPVCCPWRASTLTGTYPDRHGVFLNDGMLDPAAPTFGETFAAAGYETAWVGKWHVDGHGRDAYIPRERRHGFAYWKALECTHDYNDSKYYADDDPTLRTWPGYDAMAQTDDLIDWVGGRSQDKPFLAFLSWGPPHNPYHTAPERYRRMYDPAEITLPPNVPEHEREAAARDLAGYYAHCTALDDCMGRLLAALEEQGLAENTILVFTSDHGDFIGSFGLWDKGGPWDEALRVPMLIRWPAGLGRAGESSRIVYNMVDHLPTLCGLAGVKPPADVQGRELSKHLVGGTTPQPNEALYASYHPFGNWLAQKEKVEPLYRCREARGLRTERFTYVEDLDGPWLLYDNEADPHQLHNLAGDPAAAQVQDELAGRLHRRLDALGDAFLPGERYVERFYPEATLGRNQERRGGETGRF